VCIGKWGTDICEYIFSASRARYNQAGNLTASMANRAIGEIRDATLHDLATSASGSGQLVCPTVSTADTAAADIADMPAGTSRRGNNVRKRGAIGQKHNSMGSIVVSPELYARQHTVGEAANRL